MLILSRNFEILFEHQTFGLNSILFISKQNAIVQKSQTILIKHFWFKSLSLNIY